MKKMFLLLAVVCCCNSMFCTAQNKTDSTAKSTATAAKIEFAAATTADLGEVIEGPDVTYEFEFTNTGKEPLVIQSVGISCGCQTFYYPKEPILPGKKDKIKVGFHTQGRVGAFTKTFTVVSNASNNNVALVIKGTVKAKGTTAPEKEQNIVH